MKTIRRKRGGVVVGPDDSSLTPNAGLVLVAEVDRILGVAERIDGFVGRIKKRRQGLSAGELVLSMAECMLAGGDFMSDLDHLRVDEAGAGLRAVAVPPASTTFAALARRFDSVAVTDLDTAIGSLAATAFAAYPEQRRVVLAAERPTIDLERAVNDLDLLVLGDPERNALFEATAQASKALGREVQVTIRDPGWLAEGEGPFHDTVLSRPLVPIELDWTFSQ